MTSNELAAIYKTHGGMVERQAMRIVRDHSLAQDIAHEVFVGFINYSANHVVADVAGLLYQMATQYAIKKLRDQRRIQGQDGVEGCLAPPKAHTIDTWRIFHRILAACDTTRAQVAVYYFVDGMSQAEIGEALDMPRRAVGRHLERFCHKARRFVHDLAEAHGAKNIDAARDNP